MDAGSTLILNYNTRKGTFSLKKKRLFFGLIPYTETLIREANINKVETYIKTFLYSFSK